MYRGELTKTLKFLSQINISSTNIIGIIFFLSSIETQNNKNSFLWMEWGRKCISIFNWPPSSKIDNFHRFIKIKRDFRESLNSNLLVWYVCMYFLNLAIKLWAEFWSEIGEILTRCRWKVNSQLHLEILDCSERQTRLS